MSADAIAELRTRCRMPVDPSRRGPILLKPFFEELSVDPVTLPNLTCGAINEYLASQGISAEPVGEPEMALAGFLTWRMGAGWAFVNGSSILSRRRFSAAHELGHAVLHRDSMSGFIRDVTVSETDEDESQREREANRFAAELLMPEAVCRAREAELREAHGACPRLVLAYRLASELLVSTEAMRYRLTNLGVGE